MRRRRRTPERRIVLKRSGRDLFESRTIVVGVVFVFLMVVMFARAVQLQFVQHDKWDSLASQRHKKEIELTHRRGPILDRNGQPLAFSLDVDSVYADPAMVTDAQAAVAALAPILKLDPRQIADKLSDTSRRFEWIKRKISAEESRELDALGKIPGIERLKESDRRYPLGELAAPVLGFVGLDGIGLEGIEAIHDVELRGDPWRMSVERDASGNIFLTNGLQDLTTSDGGEVRLTIDHQIQAIVEQALRDAQKKTRAHMVTALMMNPDTGEILAMGQAPSFNANQASRFPQFVRTNHVVVDTYEPGSTLKPFIVAAALESGLVKPTESFFCENGSFAVGKHIVHDAHPYGNLTLTEVVAKSSNIGVSKIGFRLGPDLMHDWLERYGFARKSRLEFPGESNGFMPAAHVWRKIHLSNLSFGQGISVNCVQMVAAYASLVNGGTLVRPYVVSEVRDKTGALRVQRTTEIVERVLSKETSTLITGMMRRVTEPGGTAAKYVRIPGYSVAGKTGTAQKAVAGGYHATARVASFIGAVPAENPAFVLIVVLDDPQGAQGERYGGVAAGPVFATIAERTLRYLNVPPSSMPTEPMGKPGFYVVQNDDASGVSDADMAAIMDDLVPNLIGLPITEVVRIAGTAELELEVIGSGGISVEQVPDPGAPLPDGRKIKVVFRPTS